LLNSKREIIAKDYNKEGSGFSLSIAKQLTKQLEHEMTANSEPGIGSEFSILIKPNNEDLDIDPYRRFVDSERHSNRKNSVMNQILKSGLDITQLKNTKTYHSDDLEEIN